MPGLRSFSAAWKGALAALGALLVVFGAWKGYGALDAWREGRRQQNLAAARAHGVAADTAASQAALIDSTQVIPARTDFGALIATPEVRRNPVAVRVAVAGQRLATAQDKKLAAKETETKELRAQVVSLEKAGPPPEPRAIPYARALYTFSNVRRALPDIRAGVTYRLLGPVRAVVEAAYQPPPAPPPGQATERAEFRLSVGGEIRFR